MQKRSMKQLTRNENVQMQRAEREGGMREMTTAELQGVVGAAFGSLSWRAFNPQPEPPRFRLRLRSRRF